METLIPQQIDKELIQNCRFSSQDVLYRPADRIQRREKLEKARILGNGHKHKVRIKFQTTEGQKQVETTVWAVTEENIILKGGVCIPISCILEVSVD
ncbi:MAG: hypothetical protein WD077_15125 [Bacteroidia bacterium]